jgi:transcriptional regulator with XRE-family HTH domain
MKYDPITNPAAAVRSVEDLKALSREINAEHQLGERCEGQAVEHYRRAGDLLLKAKRQCEGHTWLAWLGKNVRFGERTARRYMELARLQSDGTSDLVAEWSRIQGNARPAEPVSEYYVPPSEPRQNVEEPFTMVNGRKLVKRTPDPAEQGAASNGTDAATGRPGAGEGEAKKPPESGTDLTEQGGAPIGDTVAGAAAGADAVTGRNRAGADEGDAKKPPESGADRRFRGGGAVLPPVPVPEPVSVKGAQAAGKGWFLAIDFMRRRKFYDPSMTLQQASSNIHFAIGNIEARAEAAEAAEAARKTKRQRQEQEQGEEQQREEEADPSLDDYLNDHTRRLRQDAKRLGELDPVWWRQWKQKNRDLVKLMLEAHEAFTDLLQAERLTPPPKAAAADEEAKAPGPAPDGPLPYSRVREQFGKRLKRLRKFLCVTHKDLARQANLSTPTLTAIEKGTFRLMWDTALTLANVLGVSLTAFHLPGGLEPDDPRTHFDQLRVTKVPEGELRTALQTFGVRFREMREGPPRLTQEALAKRVNLSTSALADIENSAVMPTWDTAAAFAEALYIGINRFDPLWSWRLKESDKRLRDEFREPPEQPS